MAGSYGHVTDDQGRLLDGEGINGMLECMSGDVVEAVTEMYGMIWLLATLAEDEGVHPELGTNPSAREIVRWAEQNADRGLALSPGIDAALPPEGD